MRAKKGQQKNNLRAWAGIKSPARVDIPAVDDAREAVPVPLILHIDPSRWRPMREQIEQDRAKRSMALAAETLPVAPHPFFSRHSQTKAHLELEARQDLTVKANSLSQLHPMFTRKADKCATSSVAFKEPPEKRDVPCWPTPWPDRATMHITSSKVESDGAGEPQFRSQRLKRKRAQCDADDGASRLQIYNNTSIRLDCTCKQNEDGSRFNNTASTEIDMKAAPLHTGPGESNDVSMLSTQYAPITAAQVLGNVKQTEYLLAWLKSRRLFHGHRLKLKPVSNTASAPDDWDDLDDWIVESDDEIVISSQATSVPGEPTTLAAPEGAEELWDSNIAIISGPTGSGKSAAVQAIGQELDVEIFELHPGMRRSQRDVREAVGEIANTHLLQKDTEGKSGALCLLLFEEVDVLFADDKDFWIAIYGLIATARRPIILTCNDLSCLPEPLRDRGIILHFERPSSDNLAPRLLDIAERQGYARVTNDSAEQFATAHQGDLRAALSQLQLSRCLTFPTCSTPNSVEQPGTQTHRSKKKLIELAVRSNEASLGDVFLQQTRSNFLCSTSSFESDDEASLTAREPAGDDVLGNLIVDEPGLRYNNLVHGDNDPAHFLPRSRAETLSQFMPWQPISRSCTFHHDKNMLPTTDRQSLCRRACRALTAPENASADNCVPPATYQRSVAVLTTSLAPYLLLLEEAELRLEQAEAENLLEHRGRTTRNTVLPTVGRRRRRGRTSAEKGYVTSLSLICQIGVQGDHSKIHA